MRLQFGADVKKNSTMLDSELDQEIFGLRPVAFGEYLKILRQARGLMQKDLAEMVGTSARHMNFIEKGRTTASRDLVLRIGASMELKDSGTLDLLIAGGFAPRGMYGRPSPCARRVVYDMAKQMIDNHDPLPAFVLDHAYFVRMANRAAINLLDRLGVDPWARQPHNYLCLLLAPGPVRDKIENWPQVAQALLARMRRAVGLGRRSPLSQTL